MNADIKKILCLRNFFKTNVASETINIKFLKPSLKLYNNIKTHWLKYTYIKTNHKPVDTTSAASKLKIQLKGMNGSFIENYNTPIPEEVSLNLHDCTFKNPTELRLHLIFPKQDIMQYFTTWQRYRKYWWSSITTTPSLLLINDMKHENNMINVNITANFTGGQHIVERLTVYLNENDPSGNSRIICSMGLENALFTIMLDASSNATKEGYLRLHNKMTPYKMSFALNLQDANLKSTMGELAKLIYLQLSNRDISTLLPDFSLSLESQIKDNLELGVTYTVIISDTTLQNGFLHLVNSNTMIEEQIHIADLIDYASKLCKGPIIPGAQYIHKEQKDCIEYI